MKKHLLLLVFVLICNALFSQDLSKDSADKESSRAIHFDSIKDGTVNQTKAIPFDDIEFISKNNEMTGQPATLNFYRSSSVGSMVGYDIYLNDDVICRSANKWKTTVDVYTTGEHLIWSKTESKTEIPIKIEPGKEYYIRSGVKMGIVVGRPTLELMDTATGESEFQSLKEKKSKK